MAGRIRTVNAAELRKLIVRQGSLAKFRRIAAEVRAHLPKPKRGESIARALAETRLRNYR